MGVINTRLSDIVLELPELTPERIEELRRLFAREWTGHRAHAHAATATCAHDMPDGRTCAWCRGKNPPAVGGGRS